MVSCFVLIFYFLFVCWGAGALLVSYPESFWSWKLATGAINSLVKCVGHGGKVLWTIFHRH